MRGVALFLAFLIVAAAGAAVYFQVPILPGRLQLTVEEPPLAYVPGQTVTLSVQIRPLTRYPFSADLAGRILSPQAAPREFYRSSLRLSPRDAPHALELSFPLGLDISTGIYRTQVEISERNWTGSYPLALVERAFFVELPFRPEPSTPPPQPRPRPKKKGRPKPVAEFLTPSGELSYGQNAELALQITNLGTAPAEFSVSLRSHPTALLPSKTLGPFHLTPTQKTVLQEILPIGSDLPEGSYLLSAQVFSPGGLSFVPVTAQTTLSLEDHKPSLLFLNPPLTSRVGFSNTFRIRAKDDRGIRSMLFFLIQPGFSDLRMLPMELEEGDRISGVWKVEKEPFPQPGTYSFYAQAEDTKGQKIRTEELRFVVRSQ